jgi:hypothetical protein
MVALDSRDRVRRSQNAESSKKMQSQPDIDPALIRAESMRFASSELLKIETALVQKPSASTLRDALAFGFAEAGGGERDRTDDLLLAKQALSQLSYTPRFHPDFLVGLVGFEPTTPALSRRCSNRLSYRPPDKDRARIRGVRVSARNPQSCFCQQPISVDA